ncbi:hypothetical protein VTI74DRAFT_5481 [Chaetomium olivicolor]
MGRLTNLPRGILEEAKQTHRQTSPPFHRPAPEPVMNVGLLAELSHFPRRQCRSELLPYSAGIRGAGQSCLGPMKQDRGRRSGVRHRPGPRSVDRRQPVPVLADCLCFLPLQTRMMHSQGYHLLLWCLCPLMTYMATQKEPCPVHAVPRHSSPPLG